MRDRAVAQLLDRPAGLGVLEIVRHLLAVQAQDVAAYPLAFRARAEGLRAADVAAAKEDRSVVRLWGPRGTLHLAAAEDLGWLHPLLRPSATGSLRRLRELGVARTEAEAVSAVDRALAGRGPVGKAELGELLGVEGQAIVHHAALGARAGLVVLGPDTAGKATYVHAADWLGAPLPTEVDEDRALTELATRYRRAHGPSTPEDLAVWSGVSLGKARRGWRDSSAPPARECAPFVRLVPAFDEYLLGWKDRGLAPEHRKAVHPGGGMIRASVIVDGRIAGTWRGSAAEPFPGEPIDPDALEKEFRDVERFRQTRVNE
ncbi:winged helix DNA-binding domain-containing protein [Actinocorallia lasiicapitis]